jgi:RNA-binding protein YhbY
MQKTKQRERTTRKPTVRVEKKGPTYFLVNEISRQLDKIRIVKVKILKTALANGEAKEISQRIAKQTLSEIVQLRGHTFTHRKPQKS